MKIDEIRELIELMKRNQLTEIDIETADGERVRLKAQAPSGPIVTHHAMVPATSPPPTMYEVFGHPPAPPTPPAPAEEEVEAESGEVITSPIVGIFYNSPGADRPPFVEPGAIAEEGDTVCIVEAMKVMNEIKAEQRCTIKKALVETGHPVEYGQPLFTIEPLA